jgi:hypothetical protein
MERALAIATDWLTAHYPKFEGFQPTRFELSCILEGQGEQKWAWNLGFEPVLHERVVSHSRLQAYVLMDGTVAESITTPPDAGAS